ncbi:LacI family DNA-binding transcriptional regulator [Actinoalloteichus hymeniacidonis]|uniref:Transcriptional regulator, LacI family n=1 Tax=Actinoalloteichus hymeniacidonis TaxID=340345 RepID=A0AAC9HN58_9PSEU|nr:LacI family DNA-binding transcriptional regulator [Actinoalloteichus hymeniacidonis]AOS62335.1 transcriptional regulator, LacI family [Actinoalloteichus hymeniacidonis]MBB5909637.1 DNA-binding LacI/PurR family transcriptional regulator [Actinoalloteichus hymeniacidonis]
MVTIADVARHAGVAPSTVSYVLTGRRAISAGTRSRVQDSIKLLGYHPHAGARALASNRTNVIALVLPLRTGVNVPVAMQFVLSVVTSAREHDQDVLLVTSDQGVGGISRVAGSAMADALVVMDVEMHDERVPLLRELSQPSVLIGFPADSTGLTCVDLDFVAAGALCVDHLTDLGHTEVALLGAPKVVYERDTGYAHRTMAGFTSAALRRGVACTTRSCEFDHDSVAATVGELFAEQPGLTGLVVHNESALGPLLNVLHRLGKRVPEDVSVVAICPDEVAELSSPPLTSVQIPSADVGRHAVELLMTKTSGERAPAVTLLPPRLTERRSTGSPRTA